MFRRTNSATKIIRNENDYTSLNDGLKSAFYSEAAPPESEWIGNYIKLMQKYNQVNQIALNYKSLNDREQNPGSFTPNKFKSIRNFLTKEKAIELNSYTEGVVNDGEIMYNTTYELELNPNMITLFNLLSKIRSSDKKYTLDQGSTIATQVDKALKDMTQYKTEFETSFGNYKNERNSFLKTINTAVECEQVATIQGLAEDSQEFKDAKEKLNNTIDQAKEISGKMKTIFNNEIKKKLASMKITHGSLTTLTEAVKKPKVKK